MAHQMVRALAALERRMDAQFHSLIQCLTHIRDDLPDITGETQDTDACPPEAESVPQHLSPHSLEAGESNGALYAPLPQADKIIPQLTALPGSSQDSYILSITTHWILTPRRSAEAELGRVRLSFLKRTHSYTPQTSSLALFADKPVSSPLPIIFVITPTYARLVQKAELTSMANTLRQVPALHWIVVEDSYNKTLLVTNFLRTCRVKYTQLCVKSPEGVTKARGTLQRNVGLSWLRETFYPDEAPEGVVYFADDDNTYSLEIFEEMRYTNKVSVWPVAFVGGLRYESLNLDAAGKVEGFAVKYEASRRFAIDMAGFAINLRLILENPRAVFRLDVKGGYQETSLLETLVSIDELEPKANNCTKILIWHLSQC
ncbi:galactosylgalactosylxylosylprotein 3-beta-glucuronosyltransferase 1-like [Bombina bombina]|uniref:galactosylgalactosylxylosylprotein 3-beta-glucuronosyltransferase 1-like n=1 Tax=Bombina bombina TaxID=8345 RepID=UPI00235A4DD5|nr:galactosylgalactosylxylosylprotein 3-beta-glucuronosyltransferase 1-like [Bombina bombina]